MMRTPSSCVTALTLCAVMAALPALAGPVEMPNRKPGLWEIKVSPGPQMPAMTMQQCTDATTDKDMSSTFSPMAKEMCAKQDMQKTATGLTIDSTCTVSGITSTSHTEIVGDFNSAYTVKVSTKGDGKVPDSVTMMEAKWMGACKADQKPGDIVMPGGIKMNIKDMQAMKGARPKQ
ncbi:MAG: DUF3617 family protein [Afipia sp.]|nr:MAG: DUF3617 family protein [Afipia sp.]